MRNAAIYQRRAAECRELAEHSASALHRATWRELELLWLRLAAESERREGNRGADSGAGTVVFAYSEPDLRQSDGPCDRPSDAAAAASEPAEPPPDREESAADESRPDESVAH